MGKLEKAGLAGAAIALAAIWTPPASGQAPAPTAGTSPAPVTAEAFRAEIERLYPRDFKEQKKELAPILAEKTSSHLIMQVGNVVVLYRPKPEAPKDRMTESTE